MRMSISVMAHPSREKFFPYLKEKLGDVPFSIDNGMGVWKNCKAAWAMHDPTADFHVVIQDDAIICENFKEIAERTISRNEEYAYGFYFGNRRNLRKAADEGMKRGFIISGWSTWGLALCLPTKIIGEMIKVCDRMEGDHDDTKIARFLKHKGIKTFFPMPSLIDHRIGEKSLVKDTAMGRRAWYFIDNENKNKQKIN
jgi:uncharacterized protein YlaI